MTKTTTDLNKTIKELITLAKNGKQAYRDSIQKALVLFVTEYNGALTYNTTYFKDIVLTVGKDIKDLRNWIYTYTNITKVYSDLLHFETSDFSTTTDGKKLYKLRFKPEFNGQPWYSIETDKKAVKELTNDTFAKTMQTMYKKYTNTFLDFDEKTEKLLQAIKDAYNLD